MAIPEIYDALVAIGVDLENDFFPPEGSLGADCEEQQAIGEPGPEARPDARGAPHTTC